MAIPILNFATSFQINVEVQKTCKRHQVTARELQQSLDDSDRVTFPNNIQLKTHCSKKAILFYYLNFLNGQLFGTECVSLQYFKNQL